NATVSGTAAQEQGGASGDFGITDAPRGGASPRGLEEHSQNNEGLSHSGTNGRAVETRVSLQHDKLMGLQSDLYKAPPIGRGANWDGPSLAVEKAQRVAVFVERGVYDNAIVTCLAGNVVGDQHLAAKEQAGKGQGVCAAERQAEMDTIARDL